MVWTAKTQALAFAGSLLLVSTVMVGTTVANTESVLRPFWKGHDYAKERSLTRDHATLGMAVAKLVEGKIQPIEGALVTVTRVSNDNQTKGDSQSKETGPKGGVVFELSPGVYRVEVFVADLEADKVIPLRTSQRLMVVFDENGEAHWRPMDHKEVEQRGGSFGLGVRVMQNTSEGPVPLANATVQVYRFVNRNDTQYVGEMITGPRGFAMFQLPGGYYLLKVSFGDVSGEHRFALKANMMMGAIFDGDDVRFRGGDVPMKDASYREPTREPVKSSPRPAPRP